MRRGQRRAAHELGDPAAAGDVQLQAVHRARADQRGRVGQRPAVLAGGHVHGDLAPHRGQPGEILRGHRLLEPGHAVIGQSLADPHRLAGGVAAVRVDVQLPVRSDDLAGQRHPLEITLLVAAPGLPDLDLHPAYAVGQPAGQLVPGLLIVVAGEAAAAVDGDVLAHPAEQVGDGHAEQAGLEIPQRHVDGGYRGGRHAGAADVAYRPGHRFAGAGDVERAAAPDQAGQHVGHHRRGRGGRVGPPGPLLAAGLHGHQHQRRLVPGERAVRLGSVGRDDVDGGGDTGDHGGRSHARPSTCPGMPKRGRDVWPPPARTAVTEPSGHAGGRTLKARPMHVNRGGQALWGRSFPKH